MIQALSGLADIQRDRDTGRPRMVRTIIADNTTALTAAQAITAALFARERSGQGQHVRIAMLDAMISYLWPEAMASLTFVGDETDPSEGELGPDLVFAAQDRYLTAAALSDDEWAGMCRALNRQDLIDDPRFKTARDRSVHAVERREIVAAELEKWTASEILHGCSRNDVPSAPVLSRFELLQDAAGARKSHPRRVSERDLRQSANAAAGGAFRSHSGRYPHLGAASWRGQRRHPARVGLQQLMLSRAWKIACVIGSPRSRKSERKVLCE